MPDDLTEPKPIPVPYDGSEPPCERFSDEDGLDWFWAGSHSREQALAHFHEDSLDPPTVKLVACGIDLRPGELTERDPYLTPGAGDWLFWEVEGGEPNDTY